MSGGPPLPQVPPAPPTLPRYTTVSWEPYHYELYERVYQLIQEKGLFFQSDAARHQPPYNFKTPEELREEIDFSLPENPVSHDKIMEYFDKLIAYSPHRSHPFYLGRDGNGLDPYAIAADFTSNILSTAVLTYLFAPVFTLQENVIKTNLRKLIGWKNPDRGDGIVTPGSGFATALALSAAMNYKYPDIREKGYGGLDLPSMNVYASEHCNDFVEKSCIITGLGQDALVKVRVDRYGRMDVGQLRQAVQRSKSRGLQPFVVIATIGTDPLGAVDNIWEISKVCQENDIWLHIDGAYAGPLLFSDEYRASKLAGIENASSVAIDWSRMMGAPYCCTCLLTPYQNLFFRTFGVGAEVVFEPTLLYDSSYDNGDHTIQTSRRGDVAKMWMIWKTKGRKGMSQHLKYIMDLATQFNEEIKRRSAFHAIMSNIDTTRVTFYYIPRHLRLAPRSTDYLNYRMSILSRAIKGKLLDQGSAFLGLGKVRGYPECFAVSITNSSTTIDDLKYVLDEIESAGREATKRTSNNSWFPSLTDRKPIPMNPEGSAEVPSDPEGSEEVPTFIEGSEEVLTFTEGSEEVPTFTEGSEEVPTFTEGSEEVSSNPEGFDEVPSNPEDTTEEAENDVSTRELANYNEVPPPRASHPSYVNSPVEALHQNIFKRIYRLFDARGIYFQQKRANPLLAFRTPEDLLKEFDLNVGDEPSLTTEDAVVGALENMIKFSIHQAHPFYIYQLLSGGLDPYTIMSDFMLTVMTSNKLTYEDAPLYTLIEDEVLRACRKRLGYPEDGDGMLMPGGSVCNEVAMCVARLHLFPDTKARGLEGRGAFKPTIYVSKNAHYCFAKGTLLEGRGLENVVFVDPDADGRMDITALRNAIAKTREEGGTPFFVAGTAGTTVLGVYDKLGEIARVAQENGMWFHIDASVGGPSMFSDTQFSAHLTDAHLSDSLSFNPHKWFGATQETTVMMFKQSGVVHETLGVNPGTTSRTIDPERDANPIYDSSRAFGDLAAHGGIGWERRANILKLWIMWKAKGRIGLQQHIDYTIANKDFLVQELKKPERTVMFKLVKQSYDCAGVCFYYLPLGLRGMDENSDAYKRGLEKVPLPLQARLVKAGITITPVFRDNGSPLFTKFTILSSGFRTHHQ